MFFTTSRTQKFFRRRIRLSENFWVRDVVKSNCQSLVGGFRVSEANCLQAGLPNVNPPYTLSLSHVVLLGFARRDLATTRPFNCQTWQLRASLPNRMWGLGCVLNGEKRGEAVRRVCATLSYQCVSTRVNDKPNRTAFECLTLCREGLFHFFRWPQSAPSSRNEVWSEKLVLHCPQLSCRTRRAA